MAVNDVAKAILREVPLGRLKPILGGVGPNPNAMGDGCGGGCGGGSCGIAGALAIDPYGHSGLTNDEIHSALRDRPKLMRALMEVATTELSD